LVESEGKADDDDEEEEKEGKDVEPCSAMTVMLFSRVT
jgi:hypothetical protein